MSCINSECSDLNYQNDTLDDADNVSVNLKEWETSCMSNDNVENIIHENISNTLNKSVDHDNNLELESLGHEKLTFDELVLTQEEQIALEKNFVQSTINQIVDLEEEYHLHCNKLFEIHNQIIGLRELIESDIHGVYYDTKQSIKHKLTQKINRKLTSNARAANPMFTPTTVTNVAEDGPSTYKPSHYDQQQLAEPETVLQRRLTFKPTLDSAIEIKDKSKLLQDKHSHDDLNNYINDSIAQPALSADDENQLNISHTISDYQKQWHTQYKMQFPSIPGTNHLQNPNIVMSDISNATLSEFNDNMTAKTRRHTKRNKKTRFDLSNFTGNQASQIDKYGDVVLEGNLAKFMKFNKLASQQTQIYQSMSVPLSPQMIMRQQSAFQNYSQSQFTSPTKIIKATSSQYGNYQYPLKTAIKQQTMINSDQMKQQLSYSQDVAHSMDNKHYSAYRSTDYGSVTNFLGRSVEEPVFSKQEKKWEELHGKKKVFKTFV